MEPTSFTGRLRVRTGIDTFDVPTGAQWEYACRAGTTTSLNSGVNITSTVYDANLDLLARNKHNVISYLTQNVDDSQGTAKVGSYLPNAWGLYDMHGNVWERCRDWYIANLGSAAVEDPAGPSSGTERIMRGGGCADEAKACRSAIRHKQAPSSTHARIGFRILCTLP